MPAVCLYFQVHQPPRLRTFNVFEPTPHYFDNDRNRQILQRVTHKCYLPATDLLAKLIRVHQGRFRVAFCLTGSVVEQMRQWEPALVERFRSLADTGCVEFLNETYHHSLASVYDLNEFREQVAMHRQMVEELFGYTPTVFRNTELIYDNRLAETITSLGGYRGILAEGVDRVLAGRPVNRMYRPPVGPLKLMLKNYRLSDDIAFRFCDQSWSQWPLTAEKFAGNVRRADGELCNLFMDFETFGEHQWPETGIFEFLAKLPEVLLAEGHSFVTPGEAMERLEARDVYDAPEPTSWADSERDLSAWAGNAMQTTAIHDLYQLAERVKHTHDAALISDWRKLTTSDHLYYMCTKYFADQVVHKYFNPYESPYDSYINFVNVLESVRTRAEDAEVKQAS